MEFNNYIIGCNIFLLYIYNSNTLVKIKDYINIPNLVLYNINQKILTTNKRDDFKETIINDDFKQTSEFKTTDDILEYLNSL